MVPSIKYSIFWTGLIFFILLHLTVRPLLVCAGANIVEQSVLGFDNVYHTGAWTPLTVTLENKGKGIKGDLEILVTQGSEFKNNIYTTAYSTVADLPAGAKKAFYFDILIPSPLHPVVIRLKKGNRILYSREQLLKGRDTNKPLLLLLKKTVSRDLPASLPKAFEAVVPRAENLPRTFYGYTGVSRILLDPAILKRLSEKQVNALKKWIDLGGCLITSGSMNYGVFSDERVKNLLGMSVSGLTLLHGAPALDAFSSIPDQPAKDFWVSRFKWESSDILVSQDQLPLVASKKQGDGLLVFIGFDINDPVVQQWKGKKSFWRKILLRHQDQKKLTTAPGDEQILKGLMAAANDTIPGAKWLTSGIAAYSLFIFILLHPRFFSKKKQIKVMTGLLLVILFFSGGGVALFYLRTDFESRVDVLRILQNRDHLVHEQYTGIYSPGAGIKKRSTGLKKKSITVLFPQSWRNRPWPEHTLFENFNQRYIEVMMNRFSTFHFKMALPMDSGFKFKIAPGTNGRFDLTLKNFSGTSLTNCILYDGKRFISIGDLPTDSTHRYPGLNSSGTNPDLFFHETPDLLLQTFTKGISDDFTNRFADRFLPGFIDVVNQTQKGRSDTLLLAGWADNHGEKTGKKTARPQLAFWEMTLPKGEDP